MLMTVLRMVIKNGIVMRKNHISIVLAMLSLFSCSRAVNFSGNNEILLRASLETKVTANQFEPGDVISLWAVEHQSNGDHSLLTSGNFLNSERFVYDGSVWKGTRPVYWSNVSCDFYALYPCQGQLESVNDHPFSLVLDQNLVLESEGISGYEASDLLYARADNVLRSMGHVDLKFHHLMSRCVVRLEEGPEFTGEIPSDGRVRIYNTVTDAEVDMESGTASRSSYGYKRTITMHKLSEREFEAIIVPQRIEARTPLIEINMGGISYLLEYGISFRPGYTHTITVTLNTSPDQEQIEISIDPGIQNW